VRGHRVKNVIVSVAIPGELHGSADVIQCVGSFEGAHVHGCAIVIFICAEAGDIAFAVGIEGANDSDRVVRRVDPT
jgi:hypothetical protein